MKVKKFNLSPGIFDLQLDWKERLKKEESFFSQIFKQNSIETVLDIGCGTGHRAQLLSGYAKKVIATDSSGENIDYAAANIVKSSNIALIKEGFDRLDKLPVDSFDLITALDNFLPVLGDRKKVKNALKKIKKILSKNGLAVVQFLNFNFNVIEKNRFYKPKVFKKDSKNYISIKHFEYGKIKTRMDLITIEICKKMVEDFFISTSFLCTLKADLFLKMAKNSGFKKIKLLGPDGKKIFNPKKDTSLYALMYR
jgi:SAM-dependent methyltransferase